MKYSVITVCFNNLAGLKKTAESVLAQTSRDYEWLIFDGGSSDGTKEYLESLGDKVSYWESMRDGGIYDAMNKGIRKATGEYLIFMNSGDSFASTEILANVSSCCCGAGVVYGDWNEVRKDSIRTSKGPKEADFNFFCERNICHQAMFIRAELLKKSEYSTTLGVLADWAKWLEFVDKGVDFKYVPGVVCNYDCYGISSQVDHIVERAKMMAKLDENIRAKIIAWLAGCSMTYATLAKYLGIDDIKKMSWLAQKKYKICKSICKNLCKTYGTNSR